nr:hypothetical protein [Streptomyces sp. 846.5]
MLDQLNALTWIDGSCHSCPAAYQPADRRVTEVEDEGYPNVPVSRYCRRCMGWRLQAQVDRPAVAREVGALIAKGAAARMLQATRERAQE